MDRIKVPNGSQVNIETTFDKVQQNAYSNLKKRITQIIENYGLNLTVSNGVLSNEFLPTLVSGNSTVNVAAGKALTAAGNYIDIPVNLTTPNLTSSQTNTGYAIVLTYGEVGTNPVKAINAFVFDAVGSASLNKKTVFSDGVTLSLIPIASTLTALRESLSADQIAIGAVWNSSGTFDAVSAELSNYTAISYANYRLVDLREEERMLLSESLISDEKVLYRDRPSVGAQAFSQNIEFSQNVDFSGTLTWTAGEEVYTLTPNTGVVSITSDTGEHLRFFQEESISKVKIPYLTTDTLKVFSGGEYRDVVVTGPASSLPRNFRIFDIYPTEDPNERKGYVEIRWNWDDLNVSNLSTTTITIEKTTYQNEVVAFTALDLSTYLPGKRVYFTSSTNFYTIVSVVDDGDTYTLTVAGDPSAETSDGSSPARIVDTNTEFYRLRFRTADQQGKTTKEIIPVELSTDFVASPAFVTKLELSRRWFITLQAINNSSFGSIVTMQSGSFDPNHDGNNGDIVSYGSPFTMKLPNIPSTGSLDLTATTAGFNATITGWEGEDNQTRYHEYEMLFSADVTITSSHFDTKPLDSRITRLVSSGGSFSIASGQPTLYSVGVRPLQNKQGVATPIISTITSGGGGVVPENQDLFSGPVEIKTHKFEVKSGYHGGNYICQPYSVITNDYEFADPKDILNKKAVFPAQVDITPNLASGLTFVNSTGQSTTTVPSYSAGGAPSPSVIIFTASSNATNTLGADNENTWAQVSTTTPVVIEPGEALTSKFTVAMGNWGKAKLSVYLVDSITGEDLATVKLEKPTDYPARDFYRNITISYENSTSSARNIKLVIKGWGSIEDAASATTNRVITILCNWMAENLKWGALEPVNAVAGGDYSGAGGIQFGESANEFRIFRDSEIDNGTASYGISRFRLFGTYGGKFSYLVRLDNGPNMTIGDEFYIGVNKEGRKIAERQLNVDYEITQISFKLSQVESLSANFPAILRVYPNGDESSAHKIEIEGASQIIQNLNLPVKRDGNSLYFTVDAYDDSASPNNRAEFGGYLSITGRPIVLNNLS